MNLKGMLRSKIIGIKAVKPMERSNLIPCKKAIKIVDMLSWLKKS
jgi:hypothetical protein